MARQARNLVQEYVPSPFGIAIRTYRTEHNLTQAALGERIGTTGAVIAQWESGFRQWPTVENLLYIAESLNISILRLCGKEPKRSKK